MSKSVKLIFESYKQIYQVLTERLVKSLDEVDDLKTNKRTNTLNLGNSMIFNGVSSFEIQNAQETTTKTGTLKQANPKSPKSKKQISDQNKSIDLQ